jgi:hypothetical protein
MSSLMRTDFDGDGAVDAEAVGLAVAVGLGAGRALDAGRERPWMRASSSARKSCFCSCRECDEDVRVRRHDWQTREAVAPIRRGTFIVGGDEECEE